TAILVSRSALRSRSLLEWESAPHHFDLSRCRYQENRAREGIGQSGKSTATSRLRPPTSALLSRPAKFSANITRVNIECGESRLLAPIGPSGDFCPHPLLASRRARHPE